MNAPRSDTDTIALAALARVAGGVLGAAGAPATEAPAASLFDQAKRALRTTAARDPIDALLVTVLGGAYLFYLAEKDANPKVQTFWDALVFISTNLSVGYADTFARTASGKAIASVVMTFGPALAARALEPPAAESEAPGAAAAATNQAIVERLDAILAALQRPAGPDAAPTG